MLDGFEQMILGGLQMIFNRFGWLGVGGMMAFENATGITPSEVILGLAGWLLIAAHGRPPSLIFLGGLYAALGSLAGASLTYWAARLGGRPLIDRLAGWLRIPPGQIDRAAALFQRWGPGLVLFGRLAPGIRTLISIPAGLARMSFARFAVSTFVGAYVWCSVLIGLGYWLGHEWEQIIDLARGYGLWAGAAAGLAAALALLVYIFRRPALAPAEIEEDC